MSISRAIRYAINRFVLRKRFLTARRDGRVFRVRTEDVVGRHIYKYGQHEPAMSDYLRRTLAPRDGDIMIDIGANIGWYSVLFAQACAATDAVVLSFEPDPENFSLLNENVRGNGLTERIFSEQLALSDNADGATLHLFSGNNRGRHSLLPIHTGNTVEINTARLDDVLERQPELRERRPALVKIDIEGFELIALRGATATLTRCPQVVLEYSPEFMRRGELAPTDLLDLMYNAGFVPHQLDAGSLVATQRDRLLNDDQQIDLIWTRPAHSPGG
ncbi:MAG: FkbM family methyltransferase [Gammaproteobacteria bacterium]